MIPVTEHTIELAGHRTRALEVQGRGPGLVLLHGWGASADTWRPLLAELAASDRRAIAPDLPGFGRASGLAQGSLLPQLDDFATALVQHIGAHGPVVVLGDSLGADVALRLAERAGDLPLAGVIPMAPAGFEAPGWYDVIERDPIVRRLLDIPVPVPLALIDSPLASSLSDRKLGLTALASAPFDLAAAGCPVLLVWGEQDRTAPHGGARLAIGALPGTEVALIEGCGPQPQHEATDRLLELALGFPA